MMAFAKGAILILAVLIIVVEGFFVYRWYEQRRTEPTSREAVDSTRDARNPDANIGEETTPEGSTEDRRGEAAFVHRATSENIVDNSTYIDHPMADDNPDAILLITQVSELGEAVENTGTVGVWFDANRDGRWAIFNQDLAPMPEGALFTVVVLEQPDETTFAHRATPANTVDNVTYLDHPLANGSPDAILSVTPSWNPGGGAGIYNDHPVEVRYDALEQRWTIVNQDLSPIPEGAAFDVLALSSGTPAVE
jgi:hypothetical protein